METTVPATLHPARGGPRTIRVRVRGGYEPAVLFACVGEPLRIVFSREETASCSERVLFPAFGRSAMLPPFEDVVLELVPERAGEYEFTCQLGVLRGRLVVTSEPGRLTGSDSARPTPARRLRPESVAGELSDAAFLTFVVWLCSVPLVLLVTVAFLGWRAGGALALAWLAVVAVVCFAVCTRLPFPLPRGTSEGSNVPGHS